MSSTNATVTIGLSQYVGTDKPTYLTDYNGDMLKIDNAIAADRDDIATAQNTADGAVEKADANKESIDTINAEIEGSGTTPGLADRLSGAEGDIDTIQSLIGNGVPTAGDHTLIGAINTNTTAIEALTPGGGVTHKTLAALATSVEFDVPTTGNNIIDFYIDDGANYTAIDTSVAGKVTLTYDADASAREVYCKIEEVSA